MNSAVGADFVDARLDILFELLPFSVLQDSAGNRMFDPQISVCNFPKSIAKFRIAVGKNPAG
jgi:hypothetical protein